MCIGSIGSQIQLNITIYMTFTRGMQNKDRYKLQALAQVQALGSIDSQLTQQTTALYINVCGRAYQGVSTSTYLTLPPLIIKRMINRSS